MSLLALRTHPIGEIEPDKLRTSAPSRQVGIRHHIGSQADPSWHEDED
jgi:hypothetical protein